MSTVRQRGPDTWQAIVTKKERGKESFSEARTFVGPKAEKLARDWKTRLQRSIKETGIPTRALARTSLGDLLRRYGASRAQIRPMRRAMEHEIEQLAVAFDDTSLQDCERADTFTRWAMVRRGAGAGPATVLHNLATIRACLNAAKPMYGLDVSGQAVSDAIGALRRLGAVAPSQRRERRCSDGELSTLGDEFRRIASHPSTLIPMADVVEVAVALPRRLSELTGARWLDLEPTGVLTLRDTKNPTAPRTERIPVPPLAQALIKKLPVFDERILPYNSESISAAFERACDRLGIEDLHFHDLRHEGICRLFEAGLDIPEVALISGHLSWNTLKRYTHLRPEAVLEKLNG